MSDQTPILTARDVSIGIIFSIVLFGIFGIGYHTGRFAVADDCQTVGAFRYNGAVFDCQRVEP